MAASLLFLRPEVTGNAAFHVDVDAGVRGGETPTDLTRAEEVRLEREQKATNLNPPKRTFLENGLYVFKERRVMERFQEGVSGFHPLIGGMTTGSGFALGSTFSRNGFQATAQASLLGYQRYDARFSPARFLGSRGFADVHATYRNYPQEDYFGAGMNSRKDDRTNYRLEDLRTGGKVGVRLDDHVKAGVHVDWIETNVGPGTDLRSPSIERVFGSRNLAALDQQPRYLETGAFLESDSRDEVANPRSGARYSAKWSTFMGQDEKLYGFEQFDIEAQQYVPFFNKRRVIALRAKTTLTRTSDGQEVPFFMQPALGGSEDLRGFTEYRFRDRNMVVMNAEYRWEAFSGLDLALFADAGEVAARARSLNLGDLKTAAGFGFRFNSAKSVFLRVDVGFSSNT